jgi:hypothetical protein
MIEDCLDEIYREYRRADLDEYDDRPSDRSIEYEKPTSAFLWAFGGPSSSLWRSRRRRRFDYLPRDRLVRVRVRRPHDRDLDFVPELGQMDLSDLVMVDLSQQRQEAAERKQRQQASERALHDDTPMELMLGDLLMLLKNIVEIGSHCDWYQDAIGAGGGKNSARLENGIQELCYELFSAVARLSTSLERGKRSFPKLRRTVRLLSAVRFGRIQELDVLCQRELAQSETPGSASKRQCSREEISSQMFQDLQQSISKQSQDVQDLSRQIEALQHDVADLRNPASSEVQSLSAMIRKDISDLMKQLRDEIDDKIRQEVSRQLQGDDVSIRSESGIRGWCSKLNSNLLEACTSMIPDQFT